MLDVEDGDEGADEDKELRMLRENRLRELKKTHNQKLEDKVKVCSFVRHSYYEKISNSSVLLGSRPV